MSEESFAEFIVNGLQSHAISENEAAELVTEFVRNPNLAPCGIDDMEGDLVYSIKMDREKVWNLATCTPYGVHAPIAWKYPLETGLFNNISDEMLENMGEATLEALAFRQYWPLLERLQAAPEKFGKRVHDAAKFGAEDAERRARKTVESRSQLDELREQLDQFGAEVRKRLDGLTAESESGSGVDGAREELSDLREEFTEFRTEMRELFEALERQIAGGASRRRGFFR